MESAGNSFFHIVVGAVLFVAAVTCLMFGVRSVVMSAKMRQDDLADETLYESFNAVEDCIVAGDWVTAFVMSVPEDDVMIELRDGTSYVLSAKSWGVDGVEFLSIPLTASFTVEYEYGAYGGLKTVCFKEQ